MNTPATASSSFMNSELGHVDPGARRPVEHVTPAAPSPEEQVAFLRRLQRVLEEGSFTASYKFALLHAIADLCVTEGDDGGGPLTLPTRRIAERFVELYWRQVLPFPAGELTD